MLGDDGGRAALVAGNDYQGNLLQKNFAKKKKKLQKRISEAGIYIHYLDCANSFIRVCVCACVKNISHTLNKCSWLYFNYAYIELFLRRKINIGFSVYYICCIRGICTILSKRHNSMYFTRKLQRKKRLSWFLKD